MMPVQRFQATTDGRLNQAMQDAYNNDGFLILENFIAASACEALIAQAQVLVEQFDVNQIGSIFSTHDQAHAQDEYFRESGDKIRFFLEPDAFDEAGKLKQGKQHSINKIGHALHDLDPVFEAFSRTTKLANLVRSLAVQKPQLLQSMYIFKQPRIGADVSWHQDATYLYTEPLSCFGLWFALEDATIENGCLRALPGLYPLKQRFQYHNDQLIMKPLDDTPWPIDQSIALEAPKGALILLNNLLPHASDANRSSYSRHAYTLHIIDGVSHYSADNWLQRAACLPLRGFE